MPKISKLAIAITALIALGACGKKEKAAEDVVEKIVSSCTPGSNDGIDWAGAQETTLGGAKIYLLAGTEGDVSADCGEESCTLSGTGKVGVVGANEQTIEYATVLDFVGTVKVAVEGDDITCEASNVTE